jgi:cellulose synthase/poly-beta-1,6-N-acetylglucosamine synthase-like glycosyltransferase
MIPYFAIKTQGAHRLMSNPKISIVIPAYNEAENIGDVVGKIQSLHPDAEVIVIDNASQVPLWWTAVGAMAGRSIPPVQTICLCARVHRIRACPCSDMVHGPALLEVQAASG